MHFDIFTLFPGMFQGPFTESILKRAQERGLLSISLHNIRDYTEDKHHVVDDYPYGGGAGMVMKPEPVFACLAAIKQSPVASRQSPVNEGESLVTGRQSPHVVLMTPQGEVFSQKIAWELSQK